MQHRRALLDRGDLLLRVGERSVRELAAPRHGRAQRRRLGLERA